MYNYIYVTERQDQIMEKRCIEIVAKICLNLVKINKFIDYKNFANLKQNK